MTVVLKIFLCFAGRPRAEENNVHPLGLRPIEAFQFLQNMGEVEAASSRPIHYRKLLEQKSGQPEFSSNFSTMSFPF
jgi:hypothetical protein